jgi:hypothetical protein
MNPLALRSFAASLAAALCVGAAADSLPVGSRPSAEDPEALYHQRENLDLAIRAADIWKSRVSANPRDFEAACKLARARLWIGESLPRKERAPHFRDGMAAARVAIALEPQRPDGYFWLGVNMGALASVSSIFSALRYKSMVREALEASLARDPAFAKGGGFCALGKYYNVVPSLFGGDKQKSEALLRRCLAYDPGSTVGYYYLGQTLLARDRTAESRLALRAAIDAPFDPEYVPEGRVWKRRAQRLLRRLDGAAR